MDGIDEQNAMLERRARRYGFQPYPGHNENCICEDCNDFRIVLAFGRELLQAVQERERWIPCDERLPDGNDIFLIYTNEGNIETAMLRKDDYYWELERTGPQDDPIRFDTRDGQVTHWRPLPKPPGAQTYADLFPEEEGW